MPAGQPIFGSDYTQGLLVATKRQVVTVEERAIGGFGRDVFDQLVDEVADLVGRLLGDVLVIVGHSPVQVIELDHVYIAREYEIVLAVRVGVREVVREQVLLTGRKDNFLRSKEGFLARQIGDEVRDSVQFG